MDTIEAVRRLLKSEDVTSSQFQSQQDVDRFVELLGRVTWIALHSIAAGRGVDFDDALDTALQQATETLRPRLSLIVSPLAT